LSGVFSGASKITWPVWGLERELLKVAQERKEFFSCFRRKAGSSKPFQWPHDQSLGFPTPMRAREL